MHVYYYCYKTEEIFDNLFLFVTEIGKIFFFNVNSLEMTHIKSKKFHIWDRKPIEITVLLSFFQAVPVSV